MMLRTSIATVCLSGTLTEKLHACAEAGFDGVEIFEPDLVASPASPEEIVRSGRAGSASPSTSTSRSATPRGSPRPLFAAVLHRARAKFRLMQRLGIDTMLVCSNVATATVDDDAVSAAQLRRLGDEAAGARRTARLRGARLGPVRRRLPTRLADRGAGRPPRRRRLPGQLPHPVARARPRRDRGDPRREDLLPAARGRTRADDGRAVLEPAPPAVPGRGLLRPRRASSATCSPPGTPGRCRWRSSTTRSGRPTCCAPPSRRSGR